MEDYQYIFHSGPEVIKLELILRKQPIIALYFEFENEFKFNNLEVLVVALSINFPNRARLCGAVQIT